MIIPEIYQKAEKARAIPVTSNDSLVSLFNGISTFLGYLMLNLSFWKNSSRTI